MNREHPSGLLEKGLAALQVVAESGETTSVRIGSAVGLSRSAAYRMVDRLRSGGYLQEGRSPGTLRLGPRTAAIGFAALNQLDVMDAAPARLLALARDAGETVNLAVPQGDDVVYVYQAEGPGAIKVTARIGTHRPMSCSALGKAFLAALPETEGEELLGRLPLPAMTAHSITNRDTLREELHRTRERGYAVDHQEVEPGVGCLGAAVRDHARYPVAAISIAGPLARMTGTTDDLVPLLLGAAADISRRLGSPT